MEQSLEVDSPSSSHISAQFVNKWCCNSCGNHAIPGLYYMMVASIIDNTIILSMLLLACLLLLCVHYGHKTVRN